MDIHNLLDSEDATGLAEWVRRGEVQPGELLEAVIERIERIEPQLNAVAERLYDSARQAARARDPLTVCLPGCRPWSRTCFRRSRGPR